MEQNELLGWISSRLDKLFNALIALIAIVGHFLFGRWTMPLQILVAFISFDYLAGLGAAFVDKRLDSSVGFRGIVKKMGYFMVVAVAHLLDKGFGLPAPLIQTASIWWLVGVEGMSILENLGNIGVPIPPALLDALQQIKKRKGEVKTGGL